MSLVMRKAGWISPLLLMLLLVAAPLQAAKKSDPKDSKDSNDASDWTILFRADDPTLWGKEVGKADSENGFAIPWKKMPKDMKYLRLTRKDTGDSIIIAIQHDQIEKRSDQTEIIWNVGQTENRDGKSFRLLGIARRSWPGQGDDLLVVRAKRNAKTGGKGWGFARKMTDFYHQYYSWEGKEIDKTIFEVSAKSSDLTSDEKEHLLPDKADPGTNNKKIDDEPIIVKSGSKDTSGDYEGATTQIARRQTSIKALYVKEMESGQMLGLASDLILTATPGRAQNDTPVRFTTTAGGQMHLVLEDVLRAVHFSYPKWEASRVDLSFEDKYTPKDGGSIGAAIGTLLYSMIRGYEIDPKLAITGDVTADSKIRHIGGVAAKLRGATAAGCLIVALPADNYDQVVDAAIYEGPGIITNVQVFGISNLEDAAAIARTDRSESFTEAIKLFNEVRESLQKKPTQIHSKSVIDSLTKIVELAPNCFSAKLLLLSAQDKLPKKLSATASQYYAFVAVNTMAPTLFDRARVGRGRSTVTPSVVQDGLKDLQKVRRVADPQVLPMVDALSGFIKTLNDFEAGNSTAQTLETKRQAVIDAMSKLRADRDLMEKMLHEGV